MSDNRCRIFNTRLFYISRCFTTSYWQQINYSVRFGTAPPQFPKIFGIMFRIKFLSFLSSLAGFLTDCKQPAIKNLLIRLFVFLYKPNLSEALYENPKDYATFNDFFVRPLRGGSRPLANTDLISPADSKLINSGALTNGKIPAIKGHHYGLDTLLGVTGKDAGHIRKVFASGFFALFYLSPKDYHRVHCPCAGQLTHIRFIPGKLLPVNDFVAQRKPLLYAENQRAVFSFDTEKGKMILVMVAALFVSSIETAWSGRQSALSPGREQTPDIRLKKGEMLGKFLMGSSVLLITERPANSRAIAPSAGTQIRVGQPLINL